MKTEFTGAKRATASAGAYSDYNMALIPTQIQPSAVHIKTAQVMQVGMAAGFTVEMLSDPAIQEMILRLLEAIGIAAAIAFLKEYGDAAIQAVKDGDVDVYESFRERLEEVNISDPFGATLFRLPAWDKITVDMEHIMTGHSVGGGGGPRKDKFPEGMTEAAIMQAIKYAYKNAEKISSYQHTWEKGVEVIKQQFQGPFGNGVIQFWFNYTANILETAWPKW